MHGKAAVRDKASPMDRRFTTTTKSAAVQCRAFGGKICICFLAVAYLTGLLLQVSVNHASYSSPDHEESFPSSWDYVLSTPKFAEHSWYVGENATEEFTADDDGAPEVKEADNDQYQLDSTIQDSEEEGETVHIELEKTGPKSSNERPVAKLPLPIVNVGFPKAGTSSIFEFFRCNGFRAQHWYCCDNQEIASETERKILMSTCILHNLANSNPIFEGCGDFDVYAEVNGPRRMYNQGRNHGVLLDNGKLDMQPFGPRILLPQHHYLDKIHEQYPNSTFILNLRPVLDWVTSVVKWPTTLKWELGHEFFAQQTERTWASHFSPAQTTISRYQARARLPDFLKWLYEYHNQFVRAFVAQHPSHALIEVDISRSDAGEILAEAFGLDASCWGHVNKNSRRTKFDRNGRPMPLLSRVGGLMGHKQRFQNRAGVSSNKKVREQHEAIREARLREHQQGGAFGKIRLEDQKMMDPQSSHHRSGKRISFPGGPQPPSRGIAHIEMLRIMKEKRFPGIGNKKEHDESISHIRTISGSGKTKPWDLDAVSLA